MNNLDKAIKLLPMVAKQAAINYVDCLNQPPNAWGQHIESNTGLQSHEYLHTMKQICGESLLESEISKLMKRESE
jgi:hypothetical protein